MPETTEICCERHDELVTYRLQVVVTGEDSRSLHADRANTRTLPFDWHAFHAGFEEALATLWCGPLLVCVRSEVLGAWRILLTHLGVNRNFFELLSNFSQ